MKLRNKKTGEIKEAEARDDGIYLYSAETEQWFKYGLDVLAEYWKYYVEPKEPLIKDEKIRKAVRAWAGCNGFTKLGFVEWADNHWLLRAENEDGHKFDIDFFDAGCKKLPKYEYATFYTIAELCGEEEDE